MPKRKQQPISETSSESGSESVDDEAPHALMLLAEAERPWWLRPGITMASVLSGLKYYCQTTLVGCVPRTRSSDKTRATIACKHQHLGCPLRLTVKKNVLEHDAVSANVSSFIPGTCQVDVSKAVGTFLSAGQTPGIPAPAVTTTRPTGTPVNNKTLPTGIPVNNPIPAPLVHVSTEVRQSPGTPGLNTTASTAAATGIPVPVVDPSACSECPHDASGICVLTCAAGSHHFCAEHVEGMARHQVTGVEKSIFMRFKQFHCYYDQSLLDMQKVIANVTTATWELISAALAEQAVIETQALMQARLDAQQQAGAAPQSAFDKAMERIRHMAVPRCPECDVVISDFEACSALTCGTVRPQRSLARPAARSDHGCGARLCAWCLQSIPASESHHAHISACYRNPDPPSSHPPQPHPAIWLASMAKLIRERVFIFIESQRGDKELRTNLYKQVASEFPDFQLTDDWLALRYRWLEVIIDAQAEHMNIEKVEACRLLLTEMGYPDTDTLLRAIIFCNCDINAITYALRAAAEQETP